MTAAMFAPRPPALSPLAAIAIPRDPWLAEADRALHCALQARAGDDELTYRARFDLDTGCVSSLAWLSRGNRRHGIVRRTAVTRGDLHVHSHPSGPCELLMASDDDLAVAEELALLGVGCAITNLDGSRIVLLTPPAQVSAEPVARTWGLSIGRRFILQAAWVLPRER